MDLVEIPVDYSGSRKMVHLDAHLWQNLCSKMGNDHKAERWVHARATEVFELAEEFVSSYIKLMATFCLQQGH